MELASKIFAADLISTCAALMPKATASLRCVHSGDTLLRLLPFFHTWRSGMTLIKHCGARAVTWGELDEMRTPPATATWFPLPHSQVLESVVQTAS
jgi:hypothetical protein